MFIYQLIRLPHPSTLYLLDPHARSPENTLLCLFLSKGPQLAESKKTLRNWYLVEGNSMQEPSPDQGLIFLGQAHFFI